MKEIKDLTEDVQTEPVSRKAPVRTCGNRYVEDEDFFHTEEVSKELVIKEEE